MCTQKREIGQVLGGELFKKKTSVFIGPPKTGKASYLSQFKSFVFQADGGVD